MTEEQEYKVPFAAELHPDGSLHVYVDEQDRGLRIIRGDAGTGILIEVPTSLKAIDTNPDIAAVRAVWLKWKASEEYTAWQAMTTVGAILEGQA